MNKNTRQLNRTTFFQWIAADAGMMHKNIVAASVDSDKAIPFVKGKKFHDTGLGHLNLSIFFNQTNQNYILFRSDWIII